MSFITREDVTSHVKLQDIMYVSHFLYIQQFSHSYVMLDLTTHNWNPTISPISATPSSYNWIQHKIHFLASFIYLIFYAPFLVSFFCVCSGFDPWTLHILCIVLTIWAKLTVTFFVSLTQLIETLHNICRGWSLNPKHSTSSHLEYVTFN
jgi:hypothetical protein